VSAKGDLLRINIAHSKRFEDQKGDRDRFRTKNPTGVLVTGCMDDRVNFSRITETPFGLVKLYRNIGGKFNLEWPRLQDNIQNWNGFEKSKGRNRLVIVTDHSSKSHRTLGCRGFEYNEELMMAFSNNLRAQFDDVFEHEEGFYAINCTIETDTEALVFRDKRCGRILDLGKFVYDLVVNSDLSWELHRELRSFYPDMPEHILIDLLPFATGNLVHTQKVQARKRSYEDKDHNASVIGVGTGLDWLFDGAYIINPFDPNYPDAVATALRLVKEDCEKKKKKAVILASAGFQPPNNCKPNEVDYAGWRFAEMKAKALHRELFQIAKKTDTEFVQEIEFLTTVVNFDTRYAEVVNVSEE
jgi:hypothetical protein